MFFVITYKFLNHIILKLIHQREKEKGNMLSIIFRCSFTIRFVLNT